MFGVLVSVEPAIATAVGFLVLGQSVGVWAVLAMVLVISASVGTTLSKEAESPRHQLEDEAAGTTPKGV